MFKEDRLLSLLKYTQYTETQVYVEVRLHERELVMCLESQVEYAAVINKWNSGNDHQPDTFRAAVMNEWSLRNGSLSRHDKCHAFNKNNT